MGIIDESREKLQSKSAAEARRGIVIVGVRSAEGSALNEITRRGLVYNEFEESAPKEDDDQGFVSSAENLIRAESVTAEAERALARSEAESAIAPETPLAAHSEVDLDADIIRENIAGIFRESPLEDSQL